MIYNSKFVTSVRSELKRRCANGQRVTREELAASMANKGYKEVTPEVIGIALTQGVFNTKNQEWDLFPGRYGGIREVEKTA